MHVPASMNNTIMDNAYSLVFIAVPSADAGDASTTNLTAQDRARVCPIGGSVGTTTINISQTGASQEGVLEFTVMKLERQLTVPAINVGSMPSAADIQANGSQQSFRILNPGRIMHYSLMAYTTQTTRTKVITINWAKFKKQRVRPGDYYCIAVNNRNEATQGDVTVNLEFRYKVST